MVAPFTLQGAPTRQFPIAATVSGGCWTGSLVDNRNDAWRCVSGNSALLDPCFSGPPDVPSREVLCIDSPFATRSTLLRLTKPLPFSYADRGTAGRGPPWGIELTDGTRCVWEAGGSAVIGGSRLNYGCRQSDHLVGEPKKSGASWTILRWDGSGSQLTPVSIAVAAW